MTYWTATPFAHGLFLSRENARRRERREQREAPAGAQAAPASPSS
jgi:hypothetical protein